jgi:hypothetical protein
MKGKDNGTNASSTKEQLNLSSFPQEIEEQLNLLNGNILNNQIKLKSIEDSPGDYSIVTSKDKAKQTNEPDNKDKNEKIKNDFFPKNYINNKNYNYKNENNDLNIKNGINNIDFDKNIIVINKHNLKDLNNIYKEIKNEKKNDFIKKGETIDIIINENINYNKDLNTSIKTSYEFFSNNFSDSFDNSGLIQSNSEFPKEVIEKFFEKKRNKKNNYNYISSFGINPLESIKEIQNNILPSSNNQKNSKISSKQYKINIKSLKEKNSLLQNYIKSFPVLNCPDSKIFKLNKNYFFNKINDDKNKNNFKNINNKNMKNIGNNNEKEESEEETINRHIKKKFINKKRNKI